MEDLRGWLQQLTGLTTVRLDGQDVRLGERASEPGRVQARTFLRGQYETLGYTVIDAAYATGVNVVASRPGSGPGVLLLGAHYDTVPGTVGADDNASGLAVSLAVARSLQSCALGGELRFVSFDEEEKGLVGSRAYVGGLRDAGRAVDVLGMFNLDMMGYDENNDGAYTIFECDRPSDAPLVDALLERTRVLNLGLKATRQCIGGGDHRTFWDARIPAVAFGEQYGVAGADANPCYHESCDELDRLNLGYLVRLAHLTAATAAVLVGAR